MEEMIKSMNNEEAEVAVTANTTDITENDINEAMEVKVANEATMTTEETTSQETNNEDTTDGKEVYKHYRVITSKNMNEDEISLPDFISGDTIIALSGVSSVRLVVNNSRRQENSDAAAVSIKTAQELGLDLDGDTIIIHGPSTIPQRLLSSKFRYGGMSVDTLPIIEYDMQTLLDNINNEDTAGGKKVNEMFDDDFVVLSMKDKNNTIKIHDAIYKMEFPNKSYNKAMYDIMLRYYADITKYGYEFMNVIYSQKEQLERNECEQTYKYTNNDFVKATFRIVGKYAVYVEIMRFDNHICISVKIVKCAFIEWDEDIISHYVISFNLQCEDMEYHNARYDQEYLDRTIDMIKSRLKHIQK